MPLRSGATRFEKAAWILEYSATGRSFRLPERCSIDIVPCLLSVRSQIPVRALDSVASGKRPA